MTEPARPSARAVAEAVRTLDPASRVTAGDVERVMQTLEQRFAFRIVPADVAAVASNGMSPADRRGLEARAVEAERTVTHLLACINQRDEGWHANASGRSRESNPNPDSPFDLMQHAVHFAWEAGWVAYEQLRIARGNTVEVLSCLSACAGALVAVRNGATPQDLTETAEAAYELVERLQTRFTRGD